MRPLFARDASSMRLGAVLLASLACGSVTGTARAEAPNQRATPVYVLSLSTDDVDDQAEALTLALRSRVREVQGWSLLESLQSFDTLALALKCPAKPDAACLQHVADQIHADHYVWGKVAHKRGAPEITAELHLWSRAKGDSQISASFGDNVKDASDPSIRQVASRAFGKLVGSDANGTLVVHAGTGSGTVFVDGTARGRLHEGVGRFDVAEGTHRIAVRVAGFDAEPQAANVTAGTEQEVSFTLTQEPPSSSSASSPSRASISSSSSSSSSSASSASSSRSTETAEVTGQSPVKKVLGYSAVIVGGGLLVGAGVGAALWIVDSNKSSDDRQHVPASVTNVCGTASGNWASYAADACNASQDATQVSTAAWIMGISGAVIGGFGLILLATDHSSPPTTTHDARPAPRFDVLPIVGTRGGALNVRVTF
jgi:hypothetical protein